jgi:hypothetical protein
MDDRCSGRISQELRSRRGLSYAANTREQDQHGTARLTLTSDRCSEQTQHDGAFL